MNDIPDILDEPIHQDNEPHTVNFSAQDILASLGFEAQRIAAAVGQHAAGAPFPDPRVIQQLIDRMSHLNATILKFASALQQPTSMNGQGGMNVKLDS